MSGVADLTILSYFLCYYTIIFICLLVILPILKLIINSVSILQFFSKRVPVFKVVVGTAKAPVKLLIVDT